MLKMRLCIEDPFNVLAWIGLNSMVVLAIRGVSMAAADSVGSCCGCDPSKGGKIAISAD